MNTTTITVNDNLQLSKTETRNTAAFAKDNRRDRHTVIRSPSPAAGCWYWGYQEGFPSKVHETPDVSSSRQVILEVDSIFLQTWPVHTRDSAQRRFSAELRQRFDSYGLRIQRLKSAAKLEEIVFSDASELDFWEFIRSNPYARYANVVVTDHGNLRAIWDEKGDNHLAIEFLGGRWVEYVIWTRRVGSIKISPNAGRDTLEDIKKQIRASGMISFLG